MNSVEIHPYIILNGLIEQLEMSENDVKKNEFKSGGIWFPNTKSIICGTFPPRQEYFNRKGYIYYSSPRNKFWQHIDAIYNTKLVINSNEALDEKFRIKNSLKKIDFIKSKKIGFIDIFTKISRKDIDSSSDEDIILINTIFEDKIIDDILNSNVKNVIFVYSSSYNVFTAKCKSIFSDYKITTIREYMKDNISLKVEKIIINKKYLYLCYSPIHGKIKDNIRRPALKKAIELDFY